MPREPCVYILASRPRGAIHTGATSDLPRRVWQIKGWSKARQRGLIDQFNPEWRDLYGIWREVWEPGVAPVPLTSRYPRQAGV